MAEEIIYTMKGVGKVYPPNKYVLKDIYLSYFYGAKIGVLGLNGSGKSTLLKIMAGQDDDFVGEAFPAKNYRVEYLEQEPRLNPEKNVKDNILEYLGPVSEALIEFQKINEELCNENITPDRMEELVELQGVVQEKIESLDGWDLDQKVDCAMEALRCPPEEAMIDKLSGGEIRRVALCRLLLSNPDILLLDEPTNHLDAESVAWLEYFLATFPGTVIAVTHDRYFLDNVAGWILELDRGVGIPFKGNYSSWLEQKNRRLKQEQKIDNQRVKTLERELDWIRMNPKGRQSKPKARLSSYENLLKEPSAEKIKEMQIYIPPGPRLGDLVMEFKNVSKGFGNRLLIDNLNFSLPRGAIVGVIGPNGAGKTSLFRLITGEEPPDKGDIKIGPTVKMAYVDQARQSSNPEKSVWEEVSNGDDIIMLGGREVASRAYVSKFNFNGADQQKKMKDLSGGEKNRVYLAKMLKEGSNLMLLDEPTNDLDVNTMRALEEALLSYGGSVIAISHDRWFLDRVCTHILSFEGDSHVNWFIGNYSEYEEDLKKRLGVDSLTPKRLKYRRLQ